MKLNFIKRHFLPIFTKKNIMEKCVICGNETKYQKIDSIEIREHYFEGVGQMCQECYDFDQDEICIPSSIILNNPNDADLGRKIRTMFNNINNLIK